VDPAPLQAGEYHLYLVEALDGKGSWEIVRFDSKSGRTWSMSGGGNSPFAWNEVTPPQRSRAHAHVAGGQRDDAGSFTGESVLKEWPMLSELEGRCPKLQDEVP
jgi:hypothetical protein